MYKRSITTFLIAVTVTLLVFNPITLPFYIDKLDLLINSDGLGVLFNNNTDTDIDSSGNLVDDSEVTELTDSKITGENYKFDSLYYPYFEMLNENQQKIYKQIYANACSFVTTFVPTVDISVTEVKDVFEAVYNDHPEIFWVNTSYTYKYTASDKCVQITLSFNETADNIEYYKKLFDDAANKIINEAKKLGTDYAKEKYVHDVLTKEVKYDKNANMNQSAYSALVNKKTICAGYSRAFQYIMIQLNIPTYYSVGISSVNHGWNIVKLDDGYYNVDLTWDNSDITRYKYFNKTDSDFSSSHKRTGLSLNLPKCNGYKYRNLINSNKSTTVSSSNTTTTEQPKQKNSNEVIMHDEEIEDTKSEDINSLENNNNDNDLTDNDTSDIDSNSNIIINRKRAGERQDARVE